MEGCNFLSANSDLQTFTTRVDGFECTDLRFGPISKEKQPESNQLNPFRRSEDMDL